MSKKLSFLLPMAIMMMVVMVFFLPAKTLAAESYKNTEKSIFKEDYVKFAADIVEKYYRNKDIGENNDFSKDVSTDVLKLLNAKIKMGRMQNDILGLTYKDYKIKITPYQMEKWKENDKEIFLVLRVERSWFYSSDKTTSSELQDITLSKNENGELKMIGCYDQYESITLGPIDQLYKNAKILKTNTDILLDNYIKDFERQCIQKKEQMIIDAKESASCDKNVDLQAKTFLDRIDIKNWARDNYNKNDPVSSSSSVPYYDFSEIPGAYDCTNFVSHALLAGGATLHDKGQSGITGSDQWYYRDLSNRSSSWSGVNELYQFLTRSNPGNSNKGPYGTEKALTYANAYTGDIVQGHNGTRWRHSTVVTKFENGKVYVTGRTADGVYNDNQLATTIYGTQRLIHLEGNYN